MIYKNNLSKLAMLLLAGTMTFVTSCGDDETTADANKTTTGTEAGTGTGTGTGNNQEVEEVDIITNLSPEKLKDYRTKLIAEINGITLNDKFTAALKKEFIDVLNKMEFDGGKKADKKNVDDIFALIVADATIDVIKTKKDSEAGKEKRNQLTDYQVIALGMELSGKVGGNFKKGESKEIFKLAKGNNKELANKVINLLKNNSEAKVTINISKKGKFQVDKESDDTLKVCGKIKSVVTVQ